MPDVLERLRGLSAAEDFFMALEVPFDQKVVSVNRLHILKRFQHYMTEAGVRDAEPERQLRLCRDCLVQAYDDFLIGDARTYKVFRVFQQDDQPASPPFVPLSALTRGGTSAG